MKNISKLILPVIIIGVIGLIYYTYFAPSDELGDFSKFSAGSEINQNINVAVVKSKAFERDANGRIISFYARDKNNVEVQVTSHEPIPVEIANAELVELLGHMHGNSITASKISIIK
ncbi:MAG: hypothetical protein FD122_1373 [Stygiobacter sp.]|nr:MAG: hypothetical protein FD122_1373 [Stygiobacter sp.]KAF0217983.1 MAG: hypothetical protein FD178_217 [Ignavibacteria bacterium]